MKAKLIFTERAASLVIEALGFSIDADGFIAKNGSRSIATDGKEIKMSELGGIHKSGLVRDDLLSLMSLVDSARGECC